MTRQILAAVALLAASVILPRQAAAQAPFPGAVNIDGGWVPCSHPIAIARGLGCSATPAPIAAPPLVAAGPTQFDVDCQNVNPYTQAEKSAECARRPLPGDSTPVFLIGKVYALGYDQQRAVVIGVAPDRDGVQVVTLSWLPESFNDGVIAVRTPAAPGGRSNWTVVQ